MNAWHDAPATTRRATLAGLAGLLACAVGWWLAPRVMFGAWLFNWLFVLGIALAAMMNVMIHELTGGKWGLVLRPVLEAAMLSLPVVAILALPLAFGLPSLFAWARPEAMAASEHLRAQHWFLNVPGFLVRNASWLVIWSALAIVMARRLVTSDGPARKRVAVVGLMVYLLTVTLFAYDWVASLVPHWASSAIGLRLGAAQFLAAFAFAVATTLLARNTLPTATPPPSPRDCQDFGNLLLTFAMFWAYIAFTQFFIVWGEDLPRETAWYAPRLLTSWRPVALIVLTLAFVVPFVAMLFRSIKREPRLLGMVAAVALVGAWLDHLWLIVPSLEPAGLVVHWQSLAALVAIGGLWLAALTAIAQRLAPAAAIDASTNASTDADPPGIAVDRRAPAANGHG